MLMNMVLESSVLETETERRDINATAYLMIYSISILPLRSRQNVSNLCMLIILKI